jgi:hypothetical protein
LPSTVRRQSAAVTASTTPALAALRLTGRPCTPTSGSRGEAAEAGNGLADGRHGEHARRRGHRREETTAAEAGVRRFRHRRKDLVGLVEAGAPARHCPAGDSPLGAQVGDDRPDRHPRHLVVRGGEREAPRVPLGDVGDAGEDHEDGAADESEQQDPLDDVTDAPEGREGEEPGPDDPQLGDQDRDRRDASGDMEALGDPVQAGGTARNR